VFVANSLTSWLCAVPVPGKSGGGPVRRIAHGAIGAVRRAVQPAGGGTLAATAAVLAAYGLWLVFRWGGREHQVLIGTLVFLPLDWYVALLAWRVSRRADLGRRTCRAWRLIFLAILCFVAGDLLRFVYEAVLRADRPPSWVQAVYAGCSLFTACGLISFPARRRSGPERARLLLDTGTAFIAGTVLIWYVALGPVLMRGDRSATDGLIAFADTAGDMLVLFGILSVLARGTTRSSVTALRILAVGVMAAIAKELIHGYIIAHSGYDGGNPLGPLAMLTVIAIWLSLACQLRAKPAEEIAMPPQPASVRPPILPYLAVTGSYLLLLIVGRHIIGADPPGIVLLGVAALALLVSARQYITLRDYGRLAVRYQELAAIDGMTGLYNRRHFMETAQAAFAHARQAGQPLVALMIDVDNFKQVNDVHGHVVGDQVLTEVAQACRDHARPGDIAGRYGGDEFTIMSPGITSVCATRLAGELARPRARVLGRDGKPLAYTLSIGIAECPPGGNLATLLVHADLAMYEAKRAGGNCWRAGSLALRSCPNAAAYLARRTGTGSHYGTCVHWGTGRNGAVRRGRARFPCARHYRALKSGLRHRFVRTIIGMRAGRAEGAANCPVQRELAAINREFDEENQEIYDMAHEARATVTHVIHRVVHTARKVVFSTASLVRTGYHEVKQVAKSGAEWVENHKAAIASFAASAATFVGCEALTAPETGGLSTIGCAAAAGAVGNLVSYDMSCGSSVGGCSVTGALVSGGEGAAAGALGGALLGPLGGKVAAEALSEVLPAVAARGIVGTVAGALSGGASAAVNYGVGCAQGGDCSASGLGSAVAGGAAGGAAVGGVGGALDPGLTRGDDATGAGCGQSFTAATLVVVASGAAVPISQLKAGEQVKAVNAKTGKADVKTIQAVLVKWDTDLYDLDVKTARGTEVIDTTSSHLFWDPATRKWVKASALKKGEHLKTDNGQNATADGGHTRGLRNSRSACTGVPAAGRGSRAAFRAVVIIVCG
jgi:diguanylate cyclase (GGDEF)-like protein